MYYLLSYFTIAERAAAVLWVFILCVYQQPQWCEVVMQRMFFPESGDSLIGKYHQIFWDSLDHFLVDDENGDYQPSFKCLMCWKLFYFFFLFIYLLLFRAIPMAYGGSQDRGPIGVIAADLYHSHSNARSEPHLRPTPQLMAVLDP